MALTLWRRGRRLFSTASVVIIVTATAHTFGFFSRPGSDEERRLLAGLQGYALPPGLGMSPTLLSIFRNLGATMSITFAAIATLNLILANSDDFQDALMRKLKWVNAAWVGAFLLASAIWPFQPPFICAMVIELLLMASLMGEPSSDPAW
jgi:hypothetical protein